MGKCLCHILSGCPGTRDRISQTSRVEPNMNGKNQQNDFQWYSNDYRSLPCPAITRKDSSRSRWEQVKRNKTGHHVKQEKKNKNKNEFTLEVSIGSSLQSLGYSRGEGEKRSLAHLPACPASIWGLFLHFTVLCFAVFCCPLLGAYIFFSVTE